MGDGTNFVLALDDAGRLGDIQLQDTHAGTLHVGDEAGVSRRCNDMTAYRWMRTRTTSNSTLHLTSPLELERQRMANASRRAPIEGRVSASHLIHNWPPACAC